MLIVILCWQASHLDERKEGISKVAIRYVLLWFDCVPQKFMYYKLGPQINLLIILGGGAFGRSLVLDEVIRVPPHSIGGFLRGGKET
jgi:hypothetical protein